MDNITNLSQKDVVSNETNLSTPVMELQPPLSPVLSTKKRRSRIKLTNRFSQSSTLSQDSCTDTDSEISSSNETDINLNNNKRKINDNQCTKTSETVEERLRKCKELQKNKKFSYKIATSTSKFVKLENNVSDFDFKVPENSVLNKPSCSKQMNIGFQTGSGQKIRLSDKALQRATKLFDDILECPMNSEILEIKSSRIKENISDNKINLEQRNCSVKSSKLNENSQSQNIVNSNSKSVEEKSKNSGYTKIKESVENKHLNFTQLNETQMCWALDNAESLVECLNSQFFSPERSQYTDLPNLEIGIDSSQRNLPQNFKSSILGNFSTDFDTSQIIVSERFKSSNLMYRETDNAGNQKDITKNSTASLETTVDEFSTQETDLLFGNLTIGLNGTLSTRQDNNYVKFDDIFKEIIEDNFFGFSNDDKVKSVNKSNCLKKKVDTFEARLYFVMVNSDVLDHKNNPPKYCLRTRYKKNNNKVVKKINSNRRIGNKSNKKLYNLRQKSNKTKTSLRNKTIKISKNITLFDEDSLKENIVPAIKNTVLFPENSSSIINNLFEEDNTKKFEEKSLFVNRENISLKTAKNSTNFGFSTASGKTVIIKEDSLNKVRNIFDEYDNTNNNVTPKNKKNCFSLASGNKAKKLLENYSDIHEDLLQNEIPKNNFKLGFSSASGKNIQISDESLKRVKNIFEDCDSVNDDLLKNTTLKNPQLGFSSASGKKVKISETALKKARNILEESNNIEDDCSKNVTPKNTKFGFSSASGKNIQISDESLKIVKNIFEDCDSNKNTTPKNLQLGFSSASGKKVKISETALKKARNILEESNNIEDDCSKNVTPKNTKFGFSSASGKNIQISDESLKRVKDIFEDCDSDKNTTPKNPQLGFSSASGKKVQISEAALKKARNILEESNNIEDVRSKNVTPKNTKFGFSSASGKNIQISEESLKGVKNIFEDCDSDKNTTPKNPQLGFSSASGKKVQISEAALKKARNILEESNNIEDVCSKNVTPKNTKFGFSSASGKNIQISEESLKRVKNIFEDCDSDKNTTPKNPQLGFASASGKKVQISEAALKKARNILEESNNIEDVCSKNVTPKNTKFGFSSASGKNIQISDESLKRVKNIFEDCDSDKNTTPKNPQLGFSSASGKKVQISETALKKARNILEESNNIEDVCSKNITPKNTKFGFASASGNKIQISEESLKRSRNIFDNLDELESTPKSTNRESKIYENTPKTENKFPNSDDTIEDLFVSVSESDSQDTEKSDNLNKKYLSPASSQNSASTSVLLNRSLNRSLKKRSLGVSSCRQINISENTVKKARLIFDELDTPKKKEYSSNITNLDTPKSSSLYVTPHKSTVFQTESPIPLNISKNTSLLLNKSIQNMSVSHSNLSMKESNEILSTSIISPKKIDINEDISLSFVFQNRTEGNPKKWITNLEREYEILKLKMSVIETRTNYLEKQEEIIASSSSDYRRPSPGTLFMKKSQNKNRMSLKSFVNNRRPNMTEQKYLKLGNDASILLITPDNATKFHFNVPWLPTAAKTYPAVLATEDGAMIVPNQQNLVGIAEIEHGFLVMKGVDPSLVPKRWIENHYKWIVWKLAALYRNFPDFFAEVLSVENIVAQLKYRYDREIDCAQRSCLRKILECDDCASKLMILCVASIFKLSDGNYDLELTDGWYSVRTNLDIPLNSLVNRNIIRVGTKLITNGAELLNCQGCHPLETPESVRLRIHCNSTRRAIWWSKLGYQLYSTPLSISLRTINNIGGNIGLTAAYVARVYPISFMERQDEKTVWRNEKSERRRANQWETKQMRIVEVLQSKVQQELEKEWTEERRQNCKKMKEKLKNIEGISCGKILYEFMEESNDPDSIKELLTSEQIKSVQSYQGNLSRERQDEVMKRYQEKLSRENIKPRNVSSVLKILIVDTNSLYHHRSLTIWRPNDSHLQEIKEGVVLKIFNLAVKPNGSLSSTAKTQFEVDHDFDTEKFENLNRKVTKISEICNNDFRPQFREFDTVGIIVHVELNEVNQTVWLADENLRCVLIKVRENPETCNLLEGLSAGKIISITNLIPQKFSKSYSEATANHYTMISCFPQQFYLQDYMKEFIESLPNDIEKYLDECKGIVDNFIIKINTNLQTSNSLLMEMKYYDKQLENNKKTRKEDFDNKEGLTLSDEEMSLINTQEI